jgi:hypothetical protein
VLLLDAVTHVESSTGRDSSTSSSWAGAIDLVDGKLVWCGLIDKVMNNGASPLWDRDRERERMERKDDRIAGVLWLGSVTNCRLERMVLGLSSGD